MRGLLMAIGLAAAVTAPSGQTPAVSSSPPGTAERGQQIFVKDGCYQCHGREAQGASTGPRLGPGSLPFPAFTRDVRTPRSQMPPYSASVLSDAELADIYAFVTARPRPAARPALLGRH
jgi:mono/diheme cytochrome c family protein